MGERLQAWWTPDAGGGRAVVRRIDPGRAALEAGLS